MSPEIVTYRGYVGGLKPNEADPIMKLRMVYHGPVIASGVDDDVKMGPHKQRIRRCFHRQLKEFWKHDPRLSSCTIRRDQFQAGQFTSFGAAASPLSFYSSHELVERARAFPLLQVVESEYATQWQNKNGYVWVPLALHRYKIDCEIDILFLRRSKERSVLANSGDLDNRVKTLVDALKQPTGQAISGTPNREETPFFVLLEDDKLVSRLTVESDSLFKPRATIKKQPNKDKKIANDDRLAHVIVTVTLRPQHPNMFNLMFA